MAYTPVVFYAPDGSTVVARTAIDYWQYIWEGYTLDPAGEVPPDAPVLGTLDNVPDTLTRLAMTPAERTKLAGVATGASANATDAALRDRATHTGVQSSVSISDFTEAVQDAVAALLQQGTNVTLTYDDAGDHLTVTAAGGGSGGLDAEAVRDAIGVAIQGLGNIAVTVNDALDTITITTTATVNSTDAALRDRSTHTGTQTLDTTTDTGTRVAMTPAERSKLTGVATGATANATDAALRDRSTHTGTQDASTVDENATRKWLTAAERAAIAANTAFIADPTTRVIAVSTPAVTGGPTTAATAGLVNTVSEVDLFNVTIPAGRIASGDILEVDMVVDAWNAHTASMSANFRIYLGATMIYNNSVSLPANGTQRLRLPGRFWQVVTTPTTLRGGAWQLASTGANVTANMNGLLAIANQGVGSLMDVTVPDLTAGVTLRVTGQLAIASPAADIRAGALIVKRLRP